MHIHLRSSHLVWLVLILVLAADQASKIWVKTHMEYGDNFPLFGWSWVSIHFVENNGMAFGWSMGGDYGKLLLSVFRLIAVGLLIVFIRKLIQENASVGVLVGFSLILAGALGNILDSAFYGMIFSESPYYGGHAVLFPKEGGYAGFLHGKVVDMIYFSKMEAWDNVPVHGMMRWALNLFKAVFNIADMAITFGVVNILIFQRHFFKKQVADASLTASRSGEVVVPVDTPDEPSPASENSLT